MSPYLGQTLRFVGSQIGLAYETTAIAAMLFQPRAAMQIPGPATTAEAKAA